MTLGPVTLEEVAAAASGGAEPRAGGTDVMARHRIGMADGPFTDLPPDLRGVSREADGSTLIQAMTTIAEIVELAGSYPALAMAARALGTPQIRSWGTLGGNLLQRNRCWYYRNPAFSCHQKGGDTCPARTGDNRYSAVIDTSVIEAAESPSPCVAAHPSSLAVALLAYDAVVEVHGRGTLGVAELYGDGGDPTRDHLLMPGEILTAVRLPPPVPGERAAHHRVTSRAYGEWPLVEVVARVVTDGTFVASVAVAAGAVARTPLRLRSVEAALAGVAATPTMLAAAADHATDRCAPLSGNAYKIGLLRDTTLEVLERAIL